MPVSESNGLKFGLLYEEMDNLTGKLLTIIDASIADKEQCKAVKDLIRDKVWEKREQLRDLCFRKDLDLNESYAQNIIFTNHTGPKNLKVKLVS